MEENFYTINELCEELDEPRHKIRRRLIKLNIKAINEDTRNYKNEPLEYDHQTFLKLVEEFDIKFINRESTASVQHCTTESTTESTTNEQHFTAEKDNKDKLIEVLENQLEEANKSRANLEKLLDQQQQLTMIFNKKFESLKLEFDEKKEPGKNIEETKKWWKFWK